MSMNRRAFLPSMAVLGGGLAAACSPLRAFNTLAPSDGGVRQVARGLAFGDGPRQGLDAYAPTGPGDSGLRPLVVFFYGGSWSSGRRQDYAWVGRALAAQGFVAVLPDYRLVPEVRFPAFVEDGAAAVALARARAGSWGADPDKIVVAGHSAGAYIALMLAMDGRFLERADVPRVALRGAAGLAGPYDFYPFEANSARAAFGEAADPVATQPVNFAGGDEPPLWLASGDADTTVRPRNSSALADKVRAAGGQAELKLYPGIDHVGIALALSRTFRGRAPVLADLSAFVRRVTG